VPPGTVPPVETGGHRDGRQGAARSLHATRAPEDGAGPVVRGPTSRPGHPVANGRRVTVQIATGFGKSHEGTAARQKPTPHGAVPAVAPTLDLPVQMISSWRAAGHSGQMPATGGGGRKSAASVAHAVAHVDILHAARRSDRGRDDHRRSPGGSRERRRPRRSRQRRSRHTDCQGCTGSVLRGTGCASPVRGRHRG
jgi:hypothetical protein